MTRVTILVPVYNGAAFLPRSLRSIGHQTRRDWRLVVGDDGSTDGSRVVAESSGLSPISVLSNARNIGWAQTLNLLLAEVDTEYVAVLHADDWWEPGFLDAMVRLLDQAPDSLLAVCAARVVDPSRPDTVWGLHQRWPSQTRGSTCPSPQAVAALLEKNWIRCPAVLARAELYKQYAYDESLPFSCDWLMWLRAAAMGSIQVDHHVLANFQVHVASQTTGFMKANLTGVDMLRMLQVLRAEWQEREPVPGAIRGLTVGITNELLADAGLKIEAGDFEGAVVQLRLARAIAPSAKQAFLGLAGRGATEVLRRPLMAGLRKPVTRLGRAIW